MLGLPETQGLPLPETLADVQRQRDDDSALSPDEIIILDDEERAGSSALNEEM
jgi:hypothetical protein